jgi:hypothetical protein
MALRLAASSLARVLAHTSLSASLPGLALDAQVRVDAKTPGGILVGS